MPKDLSLVEELVLLTGISLQDIASYIDTKPANLSRFMNNTRSLPAPAMIQMAELFTLLHALPSTEPQPPTEDERAELKQLAANCDIKRMKLERQLEKVVREYGQGIRMLQLLTSLATKPENSTEKRKRWLAEQQYQAETRIENNGLVLQKKLSVSIEMLKQEAAAYLAI